MKSPMRNVFSRLFSAPAVLSSRRVSASAVLSSRRVSALRVLGTPRALLLPLAMLPGFAQAELYITIVQGLGGLPEYEEEFTEVREKVAAASVTLTSEE